MLIIFDILPTRSHLNNALRFAKSLKEEGHDIVFFISVDYVEFISDHDFNYKIVDPFILISELGLIKMYGWYEFLKEIYRSIILKSRYKKAEINFNLYQKLIKSLNPDFAIIDIHFISKAIIYQIAKVKVYGYHTKIPSSLNWNIPPFQSRARFNPNLSHKILYRLLWTKQLVSLYLLDKLSLAVWFGNTRRNTLIKLGKEFDLKPKFKFDRCFGITLKGVKIIHSSPKSFDFQTNNKNLHIVPPFRQLTADLKSGNELNELAFIENIYSKKILCSLGSVSDKKNNLRISFFKKLLKVAKSRPDLFLIIAVDNIPITSISNELPDNVSMFSIVPQVEILENIDLMINHGGLNSITECIDKLVPIYAFPLSNKWDQNGNSARVLYHGIGLTGNIKKSTVLEIELSIDKILNHYTAYKSNLLKIKNMINEEVSIHKQAINEIFINHQ